MNRILFTCLLAGSLPLYGQPIALNEYAKLEPVAQYTHEQQGVTVTIKHYPLVKHEIVRSTKKGNKRIKNLVDASFYPIELVVENKSDASLLLDPKNIDLATMNTQEVARLLSNKKAFQTISLCGGVPAGALIAGGSALMFSVPFSIGLAGFTGWDAVLMALGMFSVGTISIAGGVTLALSTLFLGIPIAALTSRPREARRITFQDAIPIKPGDSISKLMLIAQDNIKHDFLVTMPTFVKQVTKHGGRTKKRMVQAEDLTFQIHLHN